LVTGALYWDEIIVPEYLERLLDRPGDSGLTPVSDTFLALEAAGIVQRERRRAQLPPLATEAAERVWGPNVEPSRVAAAFRHARRTWELGLDADLEPEGLKEFWALAVALYLNRLHDALAIAGSMSLAPVAHSPLSNFGALLGSPDLDVPRREAALFAATIESFTVHPETPVDDLLRFRLKHEAALGRLRASLADLAANLSEEQPPKALAWQARATYRNRVVPALSALEDAMNESCVRFIVRSIVGATAVALGPIAPIGVADRGLVLIGRTLDYRFSRKRLVDQHPFSYLHLVADQFASAPEVTLARDLGLLVASPEDAIRAMMLRTIDPYVIMMGCASHLPESVQHLANIARAVNAATPTRNRGRYPAPPGTRPAGSPGARNLESRAKLTSRRRGR